MTGARFMGSHCRFCGNAADKIQDDSAHVIHACRACGAAHVVSKGSGPGWWYHGWTRPDGSYIDADGRHGTGRRFGWWLKDKPPLLRVV